MSVMSNATGPPAEGGDVLQWGVNGQLVETGDGWEFEPPVGPPGPNRGPGPDGLVAATTDWYAWLRTHPQYLPKLNTT